VLNISCSGGAINNASKLAVKSIRA